MAQKRATGIDSEVFDYKLYVLELDQPNHIQSETNVSESGINIVWTQELQTPYITLVSKEHGWLTQDNKDAIIAMYSQLETTFTVHYDDLSTDTVRFAHEKGITFTPTTEGCNIYVAEINLAKVIT